MLDGVSQREFGALLQFEFGLMRGVVGRIAVLVHLLALRLIGVTVACAAVFTARIRSCCLRANAAALAWLAAPW